MVGFKTKTCKQLLISGRLKYTKHRQWYILGFSGLPTNLSPRMHPYLVYYLPPAVAVTQSDAASDPFTTPAYRILDILDQTPSEHWHRILDIPDY